MIPSAIRRPVPAQSSRDYADHHTAVYADPRVTGINGTARYTAETSQDNGATWRPVAGFNVCGGHVEVEAASALLHGRDVVADGPVRIVREADGSLTRYTLTTDEPTMLEQPADEPTPAEAAAQALADIATVWGGWTAGRLGTDDAMAAISDHLTTAREYGALK